MAKLKPWYDAVELREDLRENRPLDASEFAIHLDQIRDGRAHKDYTDPQRFFDLLQENGLDVIAHPLEDHAAIGARELSFDEPGAVLITEKDAVKCERLNLDGVWCVVVDLRFDADKTARLMRLVLRDIGARAA